MRWVSWALIFFQVVWMNVIIPGHIRGAVTLPDRKAAARQEMGPKVLDAGGCCASLIGKKDKTRTPTSEERQRCAVCFVAAGYSLPPVYGFDLTPNGTAIETVVAFVQRIESPAFPRTYDATGPPSHL